MSISLPRNTDPIVIADYDRRWPALFEEETARILDAIGRWLVDVQHVGSTAVPGLAAKPIIDIMPGIRDLADAPHCLGPLETLGYEYMPQFEDEMPFRRYFRKGEPRSHHLHMVEPGSDFWRRHILFRDYLRGHPQAARRYAQVKRRLAVEYGCDRPGYTEAKSEFICSVEAMALAEAAR